MAGSPCSWANWPRWSNTSCQSRSSSLRTMRWDKSSGSRWCSIPTRNTEWNCSRSTSLKLPKAAVSGFTIEDPKDAEDILRKALQHDGPALIQAVVDPNEPPLPGNINAKQALHFAEALAKGEKDRGKIIKTVIVDKIKEVI